MPSDAKYPKAFEIIGISGTFSDTARSQDRRSARTNRWTGQPNSISYDNLFWPGGSSPTESTKPAAGGFLDAYGLLFDIGGGEVVNLWSNGDFGTGKIDNGGAVATANEVLDFKGSGVSSVAAVPEPSTWAMMILGFCGIGMVTYRLRIRNARNVIGQFIARRPDAPRHTA
jgi:PEP-CTERM motif